MADFKKSFDYLMHWEDAKLTGKVTVDEGGVTRWGIAQKFHPDVDVANLTLLQASVIYRAEYWAPLQGDAIGSQPVCNKLLDMAVNMGAGDAIRHLQRAVGVAADGNVGPKTLQAVNNAAEDVVLQHLYQQCIEHYDGVKAARLKSGAVVPQWEWTSWMRRATALGTLTQTSPATRTSSS